jgi:hypothetical protein
MSTLRNNDNPTPENHNNMEKQCETVNDECVSLSAADDPYMYFNQEDSNIYLSPHSSRELRNELNRSNLSFIHKKILLTELAYRDLVSPTTQIRFNGSFDDDDDSDSDSDSDNLLCLKGGLDSMEQKEGNLRYKRKQALIRKILLVKRVSPDLLPVVSSAASYLDVNNSGSLLHQRSTVDPGARQPNDYTNMTFRASARAALTTPESLTTSDDRARDKKQPPNPVAQQTNDHNTSMTSDLGPTAPDSVSTLHALNAIVVAPNSIGTIDGVRSRKQQQRLGRPVLRPPPGPQVAPMAPGYGVVRMDQCALF